MPKGGGDQVGEAYVALGLDDSPYLRAMRATHQKFEASLKTMGGQASAFGKTLMASMGFGGLAGGAGVAGLGAGIMKFFEQMAESLKPYQELAAAAGRVGLEYGGVEASVDKYLPGWRELDNLSRKQAANLATIATSAALADDAMNKAVRTGIILAKQSGKSVEEAVDRVSRSMRGEDVTFEDFGAFGPGPGWQAANLEAAMALAAKAEPLVKKQMEFPSAKAAGVAPWVRDLYDAVFEFAEETMLERGQQWNVDQAKGALDAMKPKAPGAIAGKGFANLVDHAAAAIITAGAKTGEAGSGVLGALTAGAEGLGRPGDWADNLRDRSSARQDLLGDSAAFMDDAMEVGSGFTGDERRQRMFGGDPHAVLGEEELSARLEQNTKATEALATKIQEVVSLIRIR